MKPEATAPTMSVICRVLTAERALMGLIFFGVGLVGLLNLLPSAPEGAVASGGALAKAGYLFPMLKGAEVLLKLCAAWAGPKA